MRKRKESSRRVGRPVLTKEDKNIQAEILDRAKPFAESIVNLNPEDKASLAEYLRKRVQSALQSQERSDAIDRIKQYREYYEKGVPRTDMQSSKGFHDYRSMDAAAQCDAMKGRIISVFTESPLIRFEGRNKRGVDNAPVTEKLDRKSVV